MASSESTTIRDPATYTIQAFCQQHNICRSFLYQLWARGEGPRRMKVGRRTLITGEAAADWRRRMERETEQKVPQGAGAE